MGSKSAGPCMGNHPGDACDESAKRRRLSMDRYVAMWAKTVEKVVNPLPELKGRGSPWEKENVPGLPDFLESEIDGKAGEGGKQLKRDVLKRDAASSPAHTAGSSVAAPKKKASEPSNNSEQPLNQYEREREERIKRNKAMMEHLKVTSSAQALAKAASVGNTSAPTQPSQRKPKQPEKSLPLRPPSTRSTRNTSAVFDEDPKFVELGHEFPKEFGDSSSGKRNEKLVESEQTSMSCAEWCESIDVEKGAQMDGSFKGWVCETACEKLGISKSKEEHWSTNVNCPKKPNGKESAKNFAYRMMTVNPNAYFYRHNLPGEVNWTGGWSDTEIENFVNVAKQFGCGDKWGLFASHIPHRVGYACSQLYRNQIIPKGLLLDDNFRVDPYGSAVWVGRSRK